MEKNYWFLRLDLAFLETHGFSIMKQTGFGGGWTYFCGEFDFTDYFKLLQMGRNCIPRSLDIQLDIERVESNLIF